jgi:hypothetical protein
MEAALRRELCAGLQFRFPHYAERLGQSHVPVQALIINRFRPSFGAQPTSHPSAAFGGSSDRIRSGGSAPAFANVSNIWSERRAMAEREKACAGVLTAPVAPAPVARVPARE